MTPTASATDVYRGLNIEPIINAQGTTTTLGGSMMPPEVADAMAAASQSLILLRELNDRAGEIIARHTGAEAGLVTAGAACGMLLQAAAVIAGSDPDAIRQLPDTAGLKDRIIVLEHHKHIGYIQAWRTAGGKLATVDIGTAEIAEDAVSTVVDAVDEQTAAIGYIASRWLRPDPPGFLRVLAGAAHRVGVPVIVDAAAMLPPASNLTRYIEDGVDLVVFSGGKAIRAPQSTGILAGRRALIEAAAANASPNSAIGRPAKVCREEIVGLATALELYARRDHDADLAHWRAQCETVADRLRGITGVRAEVLHDEHSRPVPETAIFFESGYRGPSAAEVAARLLQEHPRIFLGGTNVRGEDMYVNPHNIADGDEEVVGDRLRAALSGQ